MSSSLSTSKILEAPTPCSTNAGYTRDRVQAGASYARAMLSQKTRARKVTPLTQKVLTMYQAACEALINNWDTYSASAVYHSKAEIHGYEQTLDQNEFLQPLRDESRRSALESVIKLREMQYYARYGDYAGRVASFIGNEARKLGIAEYQEIGGPSSWKSIAKKLADGQRDWAKMSRGLKNEAPDGHAAFMKGIETLPLYSTLYKTCQATKLDMDGVLFSIHHYAERNELMHSPLEQYLNEGYVREIAVLLYRDLEELPRTMPVGKEGDEVLMKVAIEGLIKYFFENAEQYPAEPGLWFPSLALEKEIIARNPPKSAKKPHTGEAQKSAVAADRVMEASIASMEQDGLDIALIDLLFEPREGPDLLEPTSTGAVLQSSLKKRKASSELVPAMSPQEAHKLREEAFNDIQAAYRNAERTFCRSAVQVARQMRAGRCRQAIYHSRYGSSTSSPPKPASPSPKSVTRLKFPTRAAVAGLSGRTRRDSNISTFRDLALTSPKEKGKAKETPASSRSEREAPLPSGWVKIDQTAEGRGIWYVDTKVGIGYRERPDADD